MSYKNLIVETFENIGIVKINRPEVLNAINVEMILEIEKVMHEFNDNKDILVIIITGEGKAFIAGSDISRLAQMDALQAREYSQIGQRVLSFI
ncbi:MAG: enoyl-CoA hydratase/isomerase family protein, partial [Candidatus Cloacimonetes bacterium]|nr:enoyl-CoA hydratase/isomerase family protein [Candidatus Cloacimonadota bacterium]